MKVNAEKVEEIERAAKGVDVIINLTLPQFNSNIMKATLRGGAQCVDAAVDYPLMAQLTKRGPQSWFDGTYWLWWNSWTQQRTGKIWNDIVHKDLYARIIIC